MKVTNKLHLPTSIAQAVMNDPYTRGASDISCTTLIGPARKRVLEQRNFDKLEVDVADRIWSLYGQIVHGILERADLKDDKIVTERRLFIDRHGWRLSGQFDRLILASSTALGTTLQDYKFTSVWTAKELKPEHEAQQNIYRLMLKEHGYPVDTLQIVCILRDWSKIQARLRGPDSYPQKAVVVLDVPVWDYEKTETYIHDRLKAHGEAQHTLPECDAEERWESDSIWKVRRKGNKLFAVKGHAKHTTETGALDAAAELKAATGKEHVVEFYQGESRRCQDYCEAAAFCDQYQKTKPALGL